ncbi:MAG: NAD(P)/FAD-dependent oxidoreductase [Crocinitomicaceae bacterium]|nr:NAD(P)/FAD-dependent oxidoreductase [Crocinitomicaceae bacterium]
MSKVVIIGNGISGVTAARHIRKNSDKEILIISAETEHFYSRTALMYVFMGHMRYEDIKPYEDWFWEKNRIDLMFDYVSHVDTDNKMLEMKSGENVTYDALIIATGSKSNKFGWPGEDLNGVQGLYSYQDLQLLENNSRDTKRAVIVGGGLIGVEMAEMLATRKIDVTVLVREDVFWGNVLPKEEGEMISKHIRDDHHIDLRLNAELEEIIDNGNGRVKAVKTKDGEVIDCQLVGLTAGVSPNVEFLKTSKLEIDRGVVVNEFFETNIPDVYAIGDCAQFKETVNGRKNIEQVWYTGRIMGETVAQTICGNKMSYNPGPWFNSAKFFDIEYQTYGWVFNELKENQADYYWEHEKEKICLHLIWNKNTDEFIGINTFGIRLRHDLFDKWLKEKASIETVMTELRNANFDPEFYSHYEKDIVQGFNDSTGKEIRLKPQKWWRKLISA